MTFAIGFAKCRVCPKTILLTNTEQQPICETCKEEADERASSRDE